MRKRTECDVQKPTNDNTKRSCPVALSKALRNVILSLEEQKSAVAKLRDTNDALCIEMDKLQKSIARYKRSLSGIDTKRLRYKSRRLASLMEPWAVHQSGN